MTRPVGAPDPAPCPVPECPMTEQACERHKAGRVLPYRPTWWVKWCLPCEDNDHARCASYDPTYDCDCAGEGHPDLVTAPARVQSP